MSPDAIAQMDGAARSIRRLEDQWHELFVDNSLAASCLRRMPPGSQRHQNAQGRIQRRNAQMWALVMQARAVPLNSVAAREALASFCREIETMGSPFEERDLELLEQRLEEHGAPANSNAPSRPVHVGVQVRP